MTRRNRTMMTPTVIGVLFALAVMLNADSAQPCTTAVISGKATADGRPLLWKNRDSTNLHNQVVYLEDGRYSYLGIVNQGDTLGLEIWAGVNSEGFAIMNSASYNLGKSDSTDEGRIMKLALQSCRTVDDFQRLLTGSDQTGGRDTTANFGVIDASGGAAYFETDTKGFRRFNADDPSQARSGIIIRSNYSDTGDAKEATGLLRRSRATELVEGLRKAGVLDAERLLSTVCRDIANTRTGAFPGRTRNAGDPPFAYVSDSINREITASVALFSGALPSEPHGLTTFWVLLGQPITGVAVPLWVAAGAVPPELAAGKEPAPLNALFDRVRSVLYPDWRGDLKRYVDLGALFGTPGTLPCLLAVEDDIFARVRKVMAGWRNATPSGPELAALQAQIARSTRNTLETLITSWEKAGKPTITAFPSIP